MKFYKNGINLLGGGSSGRRQSAHSSQCAGADLQGHEAERASVTPKVMGTYLRYIKLYKEQDTTDHKVR